jgi:hypothetical protein
MLEGGNWNDGGGGFSGDLYGRDMPLICVEVINNIV